MTVMSDALARVAEIQDAIRRVEAMEDEALALWVHTTPGNDIDAAFEACQREFAATKVRLKAKLVIARTGSLL